MLTQAALLGCVVHGGMGAFAVVTAAEEGSGGPALALSGLKGFLFGFPEFLLNVAKRQR